MQTVTPIRHYHRGGSPFTRSHSFNNIQEAARVISVIYRFDYPEVSPVTPSYQGGYMPTAYEPDYHSAQVSRFQLRLFLG